MTMTYFVFNMNMKIYDIGFNNGLYDGDAFCQVYSDIFLNYKLYDDDDDEL